LVIRTGSKERRGVSGELLTEKERMFTWNKLFQPGSPFQQWLVAEILPVQMKNIEGAKDEPLRPPPDS
jgi:hypothetical protein